MDEQVVLGIDVGGSHVKVLLSTGGGERRRFESGPDLGPQQLLAGVKEATSGWASTRFYAYVRPACRFSRR